MKKSRIDWSTFILIVLPLGLAAGLFGYFAISNMLRVAHQPEKTFLAHAFTAEEYKKYRAEKQRVHREQMAVMAKQREEQRAKEQAKRAAQREERLSRRNRLISVLRLVKTSRRAESSHYRTGYYRHGYPKSQTWTVWVKGFKVTYTFYLYERHAHLSKLEITKSQDGKELYTLIDNGPDGLIDFATYHVKGSKESRKYMDARHEDGMHLYSEWQENYEEVLDSLIQLLTL